jgi:hypothetical protein
MGRLGKGGQLYGKNEVDYGKECDDDHDYEE